MSYGYKSETYYGGSGGEWTFITFDDNEHMTGIHGTHAIVTFGPWSGEIVSTLTFVTNKQSYGPFGESFYLSHILEARKNFNFSQRR